MKILSKVSFNRLKIKRAIKFITLLIAFIFVYALSCYLNGFSQTNLKLLRLVFYAFIGFLGFYLVYFLVVFIADIVNKVNEKKRKKLLKVLKPLNINQDKFEYDVNKGIGENLSDYFSVLLDALKKVAEVCGYTGKYTYLNFTFNDALNFYNSAILILENKVDGVFNLPVIRSLDLQDKPLKVVEKTLKKFISQENKKQSKIGAFFAKTINVGIKLILKDSFDKSISYITLEFYLIYGKNSKKFLKKIKKLEGDLDSCGEVV